MTIHLLALVRDFLALAVGGVIGHAFGLLQAAALRRHTDLDRAGKLKNGWSLMPGAGARVSYLLISLALVQLICPLLFADGTQWFVSGGVVLGYGLDLYRQMRKRLNGAAP